MARLLVHLLGPFEVILDAEAVVGFRSDKVRAMLAYLCVESQGPHRREKLAGLLWPDWPERAARANLRHALADLRRVIGDREATPPFLQASRQVIRFDNTSDSWVDVTAFVDLAEPQLAPRATGQAIDDEPIRRLEEAVALYRGPFMEGFSLPDSAAFEGWVLLERERLHRLAIGALHSLAETCEARGELERALEHAWRQVALDPWREQAHRQVMRLLALSGQRGAAVAQYETCRRLLAEELGVEPAPKTTALYERLRDGEGPIVVSEEPGLPARQPRRVVGECPYLGLGAFREQDAPFFFGREPFTILLRDAIKHRCFVAVIGSSGSGKSSVVFAGLLPQLRDGDDGEWLIACCRPGRRPFYALAAALVSLLEPQLSETDQLIETQSLASGWEQGGDALMPTVGRVLRDHPGKNRLLLVIDQFEELFSLCPEPDKRQRLLDLLLSAVEAGEGRPVPPLVLLLTLRADFMGQALTHRQFTNALQDGSLMLGPMSRDALRAAIARPAERQGAAFEPGLVDRILDDVGGEPGHLPLLEFALTLLWEQMDGGWLAHETYEALGCVEGALARYAEQVFRDLSPADKKRMPQILLQLVQPGEGTQDTRRLATQAEVGKANWALTQHLANRRLVVTGRDAAGSETVDLAHEALIPNWERLQGWLATNRAFRLWQEGLRAALRQWETSARDEGALLRGAPLAQAEEWLAAREDELSPAEKEFVRASVSLRERRAADREAERERQLAVERRARRLFGVLAGVLALAAIIGLTLTFFSLQQRRQALEAYSLSLAANAREALSDLDSATGLALALAANRISNPPREAQRLLLEAAYAPGARWRAEVETIFKGVDGPAITLDISPDGRSALAGLADGSIVLWDLEDREEIIRLVGHRAQVNDVVFGPDGSTALSGGDDAQVILWDLATGEVVWRLEGHSGVVRAVTINPDGHTAASGGFAGPSFLEPGELILWNLETGEEVKRLKGHGAGVVAAEFCPDGSILLSSSGDAEIFSDISPGVVPVFDLVLWDVESGEIQRSFDRGEDDVFCLSISPDGTRALTGSYYNNVLGLFDLETGERILTLEGHQEAVRTLGIGPRGRRAVSGSYDDSLTLWDLETGQPVAHLDGHDSDVLDLVICPDGRTALSSAKDGGLILWDLVDGAEIQRLTGHRDNVWDVAFTPDGKQALSGSGGVAPLVPVQDASVRLWDVESGEQVREHGLPVDVIFQVAVSPDGRTALVATTEPFLRVWDLASWQETGRLEGHQGSVTGVEFAPDGKRAVSVSVDGTVILWDVSRRRVIHRFSGHGEGLWSVTISPDGRTAVSDSWDSSMVLWDLETGEEIRSFQRQDSVGKPGSSGQAFLPGGRTALTCEGDGLLIEWDLETGQEIRRLGAHPSLRTRVVVSPDGRLAVTSGMDGSVMFWDLEAGELIRQSTGHGVIFDLALAPDGQTVAFGSSDTTISQWRLGNPSLEALKAWVDANRYLPELSCAEREMYQIEPLCDDKGASQATQP